MGISTIVAGILFDRIGLKRVVIVSITLCGASYLLAAFATEIWQLYISWGIFLGIGGGFSFSLLVAATAKWFGGKSTLANGVVMSGFGFSQTILPPLLVMLIVSHGWQTCMLLLAGLS